MAKRVIRLIHVLTCSKCHRRSKNLKRDQSAWDGWRCSWPYVCPDCIAKENA